MRISSYHNSTSFFNNSETQKQTKNKIGLGIALGAITLPIIPILDGDGFKKTYKNKNVLKFTTGMAAVGGLLALSNIVTRDKDDNKKVALRTVAGALILPLILLVNKWAEKDKNNIAKKWYAIAALSGAAVMFIINKIKPAQKEKFAGG